MLCNVLAENYALLCLGWKQRREREREGARGEACREQPLSHSDVSGWVVKSA